MYPDDFEIPVIDQRRVQAVLLGDGWHTVHKNTFAFMPGSSARWDEGTAEIVCRTQALWPCAFLRDPRRANDHRRWLLLFRRACNVCRLPVGDNKLPADKLGIRRGPSAEVTIAGSGIMDLVWMASERIHNALSRGYESVEEAERLIAEVLNTLYEREIKLFLSPDQDGSSISCATR